MFSYKYNRDPGTGWHKDYDPESGCCVADYIKIKGLPKVGMIQFYCWRQTGKLDLFISQVADVDALRGIIQSSLSYTATDTSVNIRDIQSYESILALLTKNKFLTIEVCEDIKRSLSERQVAVLRWEHN